ncbi:MAG TPA: ribulose-phosphate 3-epimerase [Cyclobacteriaceae bacterium]|nr:ribulose-phosphate 3-epimerase [Cyclobacteriaceae bacterium]
MDKPILVAPSILNSDFLKLADTVRVINDSEADWVHMDIMDGVFVPNISIGFPIVDAVKKISIKPLDVHLMIVQPERYIQRFARSGASGITVHFEACTHLHSTIQEIKSIGCRAGVALNPHTDVGLLKPVLKDLDLVLVMTVNPGFGGQAFIENSYTKVKELREMARSINPALVIQVDGGITDNNAGRLVKVGVDCLVAGTHIFSSDDPAAAISRLKRLER